MVEVVVLRTDKGITSYAYKPQRGRKEESMIVLSCGTNVILTNSEAHGIITAIKIAEHSVSYEVSYFVNGVYTKNWFSDKEFESQGEKRSSHDWMDRGAAVILSMAHGRGYRDFVKGAMNEWGFKTKESLAKLDDYDKDILTQYLEE